VPLDIDTTVLAGGLGTRLKGVLPEGYPKILAPIGGRPFVELLLEWLYGQGVRTIVFSLGHGADQLVQHLRACRYPADLAVRYAIEAVPLGTGGGLRLAYSQVNTDPVLALNGDTFCDADLGQLVAFHRERGAAITLALTRVPDSGRYGKVERAEDGRVTRFAEKDPAAGAGLVNSGVYVISAPVLRELPEGKAFSWERDVLAQRVGKDVYGLEAATRFLDIGTPESFAAAPAFVSRRGANQ